MKRCTYGDHMAPLSEFRTRLKPDGRTWIDSWCKACRRESNADAYAAGMYVRPVPGPGIHASRIRWCGWRPPGQGGKRKGHRARIRGVNDNAPLDATLAGGQPSRSTKNGGPPCVTLSSQ